MNAAETRQGSDRRLGINGLGWSNEGSVLRKLMTGN